MSMVRYKQGELPPLTEERKAALKALAQRPDSEIDYSDIAPLDDAFWKNAVRNPFYKLHVPNALTAQTLARSEHGEDVYHAEDANDLFEQLGI